MSINLCRMVLGILLYQLCLVSACSTCSISVVPSSVCGILEFGFDNWFLDDLRQRNVEGMKGGG